MQDVNVRAFQEESDLLGLRLFVDEQSHLLRDFSEQLEQNVSTLKQDVAAIVRRKRERSGIWSWPGFLFFRKVYIYVDTLISQLCRYSGWGYEMSRTRFLQTKFFVWVNKHDGDVLWCSSFSVIYTFQMVHACVKAGKAIEIMRYLRAKSLSTLSSEGCHREQISRISNIWGTAAPLTCFNSQIDWGATNAQWNQKGLFWNRNHEKLL